MTILTSSFEGGTVGATISTGNSGAASGNPFDSVSIGASATAVYDNAHAAHGSVAAEFTTAGTATTSLLEWTTTMGTQTTIWYRLYVYLASTPTPAFRAFQARSGATHAASVLFSGTAIQLSAGAAFGADVTFTTHPPIGSWFRMEGFFTGDPSAGVVNASLYTSMDSATPTETHTVSGLNTTGTLTQYWFGQSNSVTGSGPFWLDDVGISNTGFLGPIIPPDAPPAVSPPGMLSPATFPFPNGPYGLPNDAPPANPPYIIGSATTAATNTVVVTVTAATSPGDAIVVALGNIGGVQPVTRVTDTAGNIYGLYPISSNANAAQAISVNPVPLVPGNTITVTYGTSTTRAVIAAGIPLAYFGQQQGWVAPDIVSRQASLTQVLNFNIAPLLSNAGTVPEMTFACVVYNTANGPLNWPVPWVQFGPALTVGVQAFSVAWLPVTTLRPPKPQLVLFFANAGNMAGVASTFTLETRIAPLPQISPPFTGPGLGPSPDAFPFTPSAFANDAPPVTPQPYLIGAGQQLAGGQTVTMAVTTPTAPGDTIVVIGTSSSLSQPGGVTDTESNQYAFTAFQAISLVRNAVFISSNPVPLSITDTITYTFQSSAASTKMVIAFGFPAGMLPLGDVPYLAYDPASIVVTSGSTGQLAVKASTTGTANQANLGTPPRALIAVSVNVPGNGPPQFSQGWTVIGNAVDNTAVASAITVAWQLQTTRNPGNGAVVVETLQGTAGNSSLSLVGLMPETRFAPAGPLPDMPPGDLSPGAWQNLPLPRGGAVTNTTFLTAPAATSGTLARRPGNTPAAAVSTTAALGPRAFARQAATTAVTAATAAFSFVYGRTFPVVVATAGAFGRGFSRVFSAVTSLITSLASDVITPPAAVTVTVTITPAHAVAVVTVTDAASGAATITPAGPAGAVVSVNSPGGRGPAVFTAGPPLASLPASGQVVFTAQPPLTYHTQR